MPTAEQIQQAINKIGDQPSFIQELLVDALGWPIQEEIEDIDEIAYEWTAEELNVEDLDRNVMGGRVFQIQPLMDDQPWGIFILEFSNEDAFTTGRGLTGPLRKVLRGLVPKRRRSANLPAWEKEHLLFVCTHQYHHFRFAYFKSPIEKGHAEPLITFGWGPDIPARTAYENLAYLAWPDTEVTPDKWVSNWSHAFDVEKVTKKFYEDYERVFTTLQNQLDLAEAEDKKMFAQTLMNRLMFLRFVERKGWLQFGEGQQGPQNYLQRLFQAGPVENSSWYNSRLKVLFFEGMAVPDHQREDIIGQVPYLNGGLFEKTPLDEQITDILDSVFEPILGEDGLFYRYNFTVEESTPLDIDVAVDPEMLGKVFEKLTNARRQRGSYYTPRTVVSFMCRETLKGYLGSYYTPLIDEGNVERIGIPEARDLLGRLASVRVVDPACGSGAYLLGMLHELFSITKLLDTRAETETPRDAYQRKLTIIQNNLYGVDIDEFAINIARLRLWLSLAVEYEGDDPEPLPNLDLKIECGDSLTAPDPSGVGQMDLIRQQQITELERLKAIHMNPLLRALHPGLDAEIAELKEQIAIYAHPDESVEGFDWQVEFAEVWSERGGFDIVLANPPYGVNVDNNLRNHYFNQRSENERGQSKDSYGIFLARGLQLLRSNGTLSYIVSDTWRTIKSHRPLRRRFLETTTVFHVLDLPPWIFDATVDTCVVTLKKSTPEEDHKLTAGDLTGIVKGDWKGLSDNLIAVSDQGPDIQTLTCARYTYNQSATYNFSNLSFFIASPKLFGIMNDSVPITIGENNISIHTIEFNNRNIQLIKLDEMVEEICGGIKSYNNRRYIRTWGGTATYPQVDRNLIVNRQLTEEEKQNGIEIIDEHTPFYLTFEKGGKTIKENFCFNNYYYPTEFYFPWDKNTVEELTPINALRNKHRYFSEGIGLTAAGVYSPLFRFAKLELFQNGFQVIFFKEFVNKDAILGVLCSTLIRYLFNVYINHSVNSNAQDIELIPIPIVLDDSLPEKVNEIISTLRTDPEHNYLEVQKEIDNLIYEFYSLDDADIREIELWYCRRYSTLAEAQGVLAEVREKYADHLARCQRILEKPPSYWRSNPILELIAQGESHTLEFKETLQYNIHTSQVDNDVFHSSLKTMAAFMNADGGTLLIGVSDNGEIKGIDRDIRSLGRNANNDRFELKIRNCLSGQNSRFNPAATGNVNISFEELQEGTICRVDVQPLPDSTVLHFDNEVYLRDGNRTIKLEGPELTNWIQQRAN